MYSDLWNNHNYTAGISYLNNVFIYEYDISKANISILHSLGIIDKQTYDFLYNAERMVRQVYIGKLQKNKDVSDALKAGILEAKRKLFEANDIQDYDILCIKNDAVFTINKLLKNTEFGLIRFMPKNKYTGYYPIACMNIQLFYYYSNIDREEYLDIKGLSENSIKLHENYFIQFLKDLFYTIQCTGIEVAMRLLKDYYMQYITLQLPVEHYRTFNANSYYHFKFNTNIGTGFVADDIGDEMKSALDISNNLKVLLELNKLLSFMYFSKYH